MVEHFIIEAVVFVEVVALLCLYPLWRIYRRAGLPAYWAATVFFPLLGFWIAGGILAFVPWPNGETPERQA